MLSADCFFSGSPVSKAKVNFVHSLIAVVAGNVVYFLLMPYLPQPARHTPMHFDLGVIIDFWICLVFLGAIKTSTKWGKRSREDSTERQ